MQILVCSLLQSLEVQGQLHDFMCACRQMRSCCYWRALTWQAWATGQPWRSMWAPRAKTHVDSTTTEYTSTPLLSLSLCPPQAWPPSTSCRLVHWVDRLLMSQTGVLPPLQLLQFSELQLSCSNPDVAMPSAGWQGQAEGAHWGCPAGSQPSA